MKVEHHILDIAESLFNRQGYTAVGVDLIRDEAKVSKTSIYRLFGDKNGLIAAVLLRRHERFQRSLSAVIDSQGAREKNLLAILNWHFDWFDSADFAGCMFAHALSEFKQQSPVIRQIALEHKIGLQAVICEALGGDIKCREQAADMLLTFLEGMIVRAEFMALSSERDHYRDIFLCIAAERYVEASH